MLIKSANGLYVFDVRKLQIEIIFQNEKNNKILAWFANNSTVYIVKSKIPAVYSYNLITKAENELVKLPENLSAIIEIKTSESGSEIGLMEKSGALSIFNVKDKKFRQIADNAKKFSFSPDSKNYFLLIITTK